MSDEQKEPTKLKLVSKGNSVKFDDGRTAAMEVFDFEDIAERMMKCERGVSTLRDIAGYYGVHFTLLWRFLQLPAYKKRMEEIEKITAEMWAEKPMEILWGKESESNWEENRVKSKVEYCNRMASFKNRAKYGNKLNVEVEDPLGTPEARMQLIAELERKMLGGGNE